MLPPVSIEPLDFWFQVQHSPFWTNLAFNCKSDTLGSLFSHALLILTKSSKSKNQVVHEQEFKDLSSTCHINSERRVLGLESEVLGFNTHCGVAFCYWNFLFSHSKASNANIDIIV